MFAPHCVFWFFTGFMSIGFWYSPGPYRKKTWGKNFDSSVILANTWTNFAPRGVLVTGVCSMTGAAVSSARAAAENSKTRAAATDRMRDPLENFPLGTLGDKAESGKWV